MMNKRVFHIASTAIVFLSCLLFFLSQEKVEKKGCASTCKINNTQKIEKELLLISKEGSTKCCQPNNPLPFRNAELGFNSSTSSFFISNFQTNGISWDYFGHLTSCISPQCSHFDDFHKVLSKKYQGYLFWICQLLL